MGEYRGLDRLRPGESAVVRELRAGDALRGRLLELGLVEGARVDCVGIAPLGDPIAYRISGAVIAIRARDGAGVLVSPWA